MGTQGTGRKRSTKKERSTAEDDALNLIAREVSSGPRYDPRTLVPTRMMCPDMFVATGADLCHIDLELEDNKYIYIYTDFLKFLN